MRRSFLVMYALAVGTLGVWAANPGTMTNVQPRTVTLKGKDIPIAKVLAELAKQTGVTVADRRGDQSKPMLTLDLEQVLFWPALDDIARKADARVSLYQADSSLALIRSTASPAPTAYGGIFRSTARRLTLTRDLDTGAHTCEALVEFAWEPWFQPLLFRVRSYTATFEPEAGGKSLAVHGLGQNADQVRGRPALEADLRVTVPTRTAAKSLGLKGVVSAIGSGKMLTARFDNLAGAKPQTFTEDGVRVTLRRLEVVEKDRWEAEVALAYPPGGPQFESYQNWLVNNRIYLEKGKGKDLVRLEPRPEEQTGGQSPSSNSATVIYYFKERKNGLRLGKPGDWTLVYRTPGPFVEVSASFEFKDLPLP